MAFQLGQSQSILVLGYTAKYGKTSYETQNQPNMPLKGSITNPPADIFGLHTFLSRSVPSV